MHGKTSQIHHRGEGVFNGLSQPFEATRYHSLVVEKESLPDCLEDDENVAATCRINGADIPVAVHSGSVLGVQFHPERSGPAGLRLVAGFARARR